MAKQEAGGGRAPVDLTTGLLPRRFHLLFGASVVSNLGDGLAFTAFPLLAASVTHSPVLIALVTACGTLPFAILGLFAGVLADRQDRRRVMVTVDVLRAIAVAGLVVCIVDGHASIPILAAFSACIGAGACLFTIASQAVVPAVVESLDRPRLSRANGRLFGSEVFGVQLAGPAIGGAVFAVSHHLPFTVDAVSFGLSALLVGLIPGRYRDPAASTAGASVRASIAAGVAYVAHHRLLRTQTLASAGVNLSLAAQEAVLVVLAERRLDLGSTGYGLLFASLAVGGLVATAMAGRLARWWHEATVLRVGFAVMPVGAVLTGAAPDAVVCGLGLAITSFGLLTWNVGVGPLRQAIVPPAMLGRVYSASLLPARAALPLGAVIGGALAGIDPRLPFLASGGFLAAVLVVCLPALSRSEVDVERARAIERLAAPDPQAGLPHPTHRHPA